jgi:hypothetical protein
MVEGAGLVDIEGDFFVFCGRALMLSLSVVTLSCLELAEFRKGFVAPFCSVVDVDSCYEVSPERLCMSFFSISVGCSFWVGLSN